MHAHRGVLALLDLVVDHREKLVQLDDVVLEQLVALLDNGHGGLLGVHGCDLAAESVVLVAQGSELVVQGRVFLV